MRKRSKYRPRNVRLDTISHVLTGIKPLSSIDDELIKIQIKNHDALASIAQGRATRSDMDAIMVALNMAEALTAQHVGKAYREQIRAGQDALAELAARGKVSQAFVCRGQELTAINWAMEIHDAQLEVITVAQLEQAIKKVANTIRSGGAKAI